MSNTIPTKVFMNGNSQAVRIPQEFRLDTKDVEISRTISGDLLIRAVHLDRGTAFLQALERFDDEVPDDFLQSLEDEEENAQIPQERDDL